MAQPRAHLPSSSPPLTCRRALPCLLPQPRRRLGITRAPRLAEPATRAPARAKTPAPCPASPPRRARSLRRVEASCTDRAHRAKAQPRRQPDASPCAPLHPSHRAEPSCSLPRPDAPKLTWPRPVPDLTPPLRDTERRDARNRPRLFHFYFNGVYCVRYSLLLLA
jgi:hypothetical protein